MLAAALGGGVSMVILIVVVMGTVVVALVLYYQRKIKKSSQTEINPEYAIVNPVPPPLPHPRVQFGENVAYHAAVESSIDEHDYEAVDRDAESEYEVPTAENITYESVDKSVEYEVPIVENIAYGKFSEARS